MYVLVNKLKDGLHTVYIISNSHHLIMFNWLCDLILLKSIRWILVCTRRWGASFGSFHSFCNPLKLHSILFWRMLWHSTASFLTAVAKGKCQNCHSSSSCMQEWFCVHDKESLKATHSVWLDIKYCESSACGDKSVVAIWNKADQSLILQLMNDEYAFMKYS